MDALLARVIDEADAGQLPVLIEDWLAAGDARHWIARALKIDLAVLVERPELAVPCLLRRCTWFGDEFPRYVHRPPPPPDAAAVRGLARSWEASWRRPYLRSLRTPAVPLDGGVIEEYRGGGAGPLWMTPAHVGRGDDIAWDRASGRRVRTAMPAPRAPAWRIENGSLVSATRARRVELGDDYSLDDEVIAADDERAIVMGHYDEGYGQGWSWRSYCIDLTTGRQVFQYDGFCSAAACHAGRVFTVNGSTLTTWSATGEVLASGVIAGEDLVFATDGSFATRTEQVIRVYDPVRVLAIQHEKAYTLGLVGLSPDGTRAITGQVLCDARTGEELARVEFHGIDGQWFEGGPPRDCRALCDDVVAELLPFGYRLWDSTTGEILVDDRNHRASLGDAVAFAPNGRTHAVLHGGVVRIYDNHSLRVLNEHPLAAGGGGAIRLALSRDGSTVWWGPCKEPLKPMLSDHAAAPLALPQNATIVDGVVTLGGLQLPIDDVHAEVSAGGKVIVGWFSHYVVG
ncbi:MAG TPA: hypothetical protein VIV58_16650 [Kofleriaceae bacterium]